MTTESLASSAFITNEVMGWIAYTKSGKSILEGENAAKHCGGVNYSSDALPADDIIAMGYFPLVEGVPQILCQINLGRDERFVRYWTTVWTNGAGAKRIYALGWYRLVNDERRYSLLFYYPNDNKIVVASHRSVCPPFHPDTFSLLPSDAHIKKGDSYFGWFLYGDTSYVFHTSSGVVFRSTWEDPYPNHRLLSSV